MDSKFGEACSCIPGAWRVPRPRPPPAWQTGLLPATCTPLDAARAPAARVQGGAEPAPARRGQFRPPWHSPWGQQGSLAEEGSSPPRLVPSFQYCGFVFACALLLFWRSPGSGQPHHARCMPGSGQPQQACRAHPTNSRGPPEKFCLATPRRRRLGWWKDSPHLTGKAPV